MYGTCDGRRPLSTGEPQSFMSYSGRSCSARRIRVTLLPIRHAQDIPMPRRFDGLTPYEGYEDAIVEKTDGVVTFTLNRPEKLNALSPALRLGLKRILEDVNDDDGAKVLVLTGAGRGFCAGADMVGQSHSSSPPPSRQDIEESRFGWIGR